MRAEQWKSLCFTPFAGLAVGIALFLASSPALGQEECVGGELDKAGQTMTHPGAWHPRRMNEAKTRG